MLSLEPIELLHHGGDVRDHIRCDDVEPMHLRAFLAREPVDVDGAAGGFEARQLLRRERS
jgi:hypothetical protein